MNQNHLVNSNQEQRVSNQAQKPYFYRPKPIRPEARPSNVLDFFSAHPPRFQQFNIQKYSGAFAVINNTLPSNQNFPLCLKNTKGEEVLTTTSDDFIGNGLSTGSSLNGMEGPSEGIQIKQIQLVLKPKYAGSTHTLQFSNPTASFSTRCDVIYKTLLRDCRRYYYDSFDMKRMRKNRRVYHLSKTLSLFVQTNFEHATEEFKRELKFTLGCLVYPKEMTNAKVLIYDQDGNVVKGAERTKKLKKVKELHAYLYSFSMDKCEKFFKNPYLSVLFGHYLDNFQERVEANETLKKNEEVYYAAIKLIRKLLKETKENEEANMS